MLIPFWAQIITEYWCVFHVLSELWILEVHFLSSDQENIVENHIENMVELASHLEETSRRLCGFGQFMNFLKINALFMVSRT